MAMVPFVEHSLRCRLQHAELEFVVDERGQPHLLWVNHAVKQQPPPQPHTGPSFSKTAATAAATGIATTTAKRRSSDAAAEAPCRRVSVVQEQQQQPEGGASETLADWATANRARFQAMIEAVTGSGVKGSLLLVDTEVDEVLRAADVLVREGFSVVVATDGSKALSLTRLRDFDCMLIATQLPSLSGVEVTRVLRQREAGLLSSARLTAGSGAAVPHLPIVAFTANTAPDALRVYMDCGMDGWCVRACVTSGGFSCDCT